MRCWTGCRASSAILYRKKESVLLSLLPGSRAQGPQILVLSGLRSLNLVIVNVRSQKLQLISVNTFLFSQKEKYLSYRNNLSHQVEVRAELCRYSSFSRPRIFRSSA